MGLFNSWKRVLKLLLCLIMVTQFSACTGLSSDTDGILSSNSENAELEKNAQTKIEYPVKRMYHSRNTVVFLLSDGRILEVFNPWGGDGMVQILKDVSNVRTIGFDTISSCPIFITKSGEMIRYNHYYKDGIEMETLYNNAVLCTGQRAQYVITKEGSADILSTEFVSDYAKERFLGLNGIRNVYENRYMLYVIFQDGSITVLGIDEDDEKIVGLIREALSEFDDVVDGDGDYILHSDGTVSCIITNRDDSTGKIVSIDIQKIPLTDVVSIGSGEEELFLRADGSLYSSIDYTQPLLTGIRDFSCNKTELSVLTDHYSLDCYNVDENYSEQSINLSLVYSTDLSSYYDI